MTRRAVQVQIDLGATDHLTLLHHGHDSSVAIATNSDRWREKVYSKAAAIEQAGILSAGGAVDCYVAQNPTQEGKRRAITNLSCLQTLYVDLDSYNVPSLAGLDCMQVYDRIRDALPDLPVPTMIASSGKGASLVWTLKAVVPRSSLPDWQLIENNLIDLLIPFGADPKAKDAARVLRVSGTENSKSGTYAEYHHIAPPASFEAMQRYSNKVSKAKQPAVAKSQPVTPGRPTTRPTSRRPNNVRGIGKHTAKNPFTLAYARMNDIRTLAELRGGRLTDLRKTAIYAYALSAAWYSYTVQQLRREVECFIEDCVSSPEAYKAKHMPLTVFGRKEQSIEGLTIEWQGQRWDARYRIRNDTLINLLQITPAEQQHMTSIISTSEKYARKNLKRNQKRWAEGKATRQAYVAAAAERCQLALELSAAGARQADIAKALNVSVRSVRNYVKA
jgi:hypothetical protein